MAIIFPVTLLPNDRYPEIATRMYTQQAEPMLAPMTVVVLDHKSELKDQL